MQGIIDSIKNDRSFDMGELLDLSEAHPELLAFTQDIYQLSAALQALQGSLRREDIAPALKE